MFLAFKKGLPLFAATIFPDLWLYAEPSKSAHSVPVVTGTTLGQFVDQVRDKAKLLESSAGMQRGFQSLISAHKLSAEKVNYSDYVLIRLLFEATRDAGFWNLHWTITNLEPNSDAIWKQWRVIKTLSVLTPTASAECDEISALYAFLTRRAGVKGIGLFWPASNHTVAVWTIRVASGSDIRVVVPTTQIFLTATDMFDTKTFDPWRQKSIYDYTRHDVPDSIELPKPLLDFFLVQIDKYGGASDATLQEIRYLRDAVLQNTWTSEQAAREADRKRLTLGDGLAEDIAAFRYFAKDMRTH